MMTISLVSRLLIGNKIPNSNLIIIETTTCLGNDDKLIGYQAVISQWNPFTDQVQILIWNCKDNQIVYFDKNICILVSKPRLQKLL
jgi:hypothetical protein